jgi:hypothetical protein
MPDFLDSLIGQVKETVPALHPRTPGLFEPAPSRVGPGERFYAPRGFSPDPASPDSTQGPLAEIRLPAQPINARTRPGEPDGAPDRNSAATGGPAQGRPDAFNRLPAGQLTPSTSEVPPPAPAFPPAGLPARLNHLDALLRGARPPGPQTERRLSPDAGGIPQSSYSPEGDLAPLSLEAAQPGSRSSTGLLPSRQDSDLSLSRGRTLAPSNPVSHPGSPSGEGRVTPLNDAESMSGETPLWAVQPLKVLSGEIEALRRHKPSELSARETSSPVMTPVGSPNPVTTRPAEHLPQPGGNRARGETPLLIQVSIGRVEVRAAPAPAPARSSAARGAAPTSLDEFLRRTNGGSQ